MHILLYWRRILKILDKMVYLINIFYHTDVLRKDNTNFPRQHAYHKHLRWSLWIKRCVQLKLNVNKRVHYNKWFVKDHTPLESYHFMTGFWACQWNQCSQEHIKTHSKATIRKIHQKLENRSRDRFSMSWVTSENAFSCSIHSVKKWKKSIAISIFVPVGFDWIPRKLCKMELVS